MDALSIYKQKMSEAIRLDDNEDMVIQNLPLVVFLAKRFHGDYPALDLEDLVGWGNIGLVKAANNFDTDRDIRFSTYASTIIYREFLKGMVDHQNRGCRLPRKTFEQVQIVATYVEEHGRLPLLEDLEPLLTRKTPLPEERYREILNAWQSSLPYAGEIKADLLEDQVEGEDDIDEDTERWVNESLADYACNRPSEEVSRGGSSETQG